MANKQAVLGRPLPDASVPRNAFDRSFNRSLHYSVGMAIPSSGAIPVIAGSHSKINRKIFQRTNDVYTAAFTPLDTHMQFYFVPMRQLMSEWDDFKLNIQDFNSSFYAHSSDPAVVPQPAAKAPWCMMSEIKAALLAANDGSGTQQYDACGYPLRQGGLRLLNLLGYGNYTSIEEMGDDVEVNLLRLCAYQKVYFDHFRNTAYESNNPLYYNMDYYRSNGYHVNDIRVLQGLLTLRYVNYRKDYFQNLYPALTYVTSSPAGNDWLIPSWVQGSNYNNMSGSVQVPITGNTGSDDGRWKSVNAATDGPNARFNDTGTGLNKLYAGGQAQATHTHSMNGLGTIGANDIIATINPQTIRASFALDKLLRSSAYAPKHAKDQYEARYGIKFKYNPNESVFIGSFMNDIVINEVTNMAQTADNNIGANLGDIGGKGVGSADYGSTLDFSNMEDGFIIPIMYTLPRTSYSSNRIDTYNLKVDRNQFFIPEFMDMGLRPVTRREYYDALPDGSSLAPDAANAVLGYQPPYQEYKIGIDENMGLFGRPQNDNEYTRFVINSNIPTSVGQTLGSGVNYQFFKVKPADVKNIFRVNYDGTYMTDQIITYLRTSIVVNQNMSVHGQPRLGS